MYAQDEEENEYLDGEGEDVLVPLTTTKRSKVKDRTGKTSIRETTVLKWRACIHCNLVLSEEQFMENGCLNCVDLGLDNNREAIWANTTTNFKGLVAVLKPELSWVARHNHIGGRVGVYAVSVLGPSQY